MKAFCVKDRSMQEMANPRAIVMKNGRHAITGICAKCGTKMFRIGKAEQAAA